jgi:hypothetical protein
MLLLLTTALAAMPPGIDLDAVQRWDGRADVLLDGPPGCWEVVGKASWNWDLGRWGGSRGDAVFAGRLVDGQWSEVHLAPLGEISRESKREAEVRVYAKEARFAPLIGRLTGQRITVATDDTEVAVDAEEQASASNVLRTTLDRIGGAVETTWAEWDADAEAVRLHRVVPIGDGARAPEAEVTVRFPGGDELPTALDVAFPDQFKAGSWPRRFTIRDAEVHLRGAVAAGRVFPAAESFRFEFGLMGFWGSGAQTIRYHQIKACPAPEGAPQPPIAVEPAAADAVEADAG